MKADTPDPEEVLSADADLRAALQHRDAEIERREELARELEALVQRAEELLEKTRGGRRSGADGGSPVRRGADRL